MSLSDIIIKRSFVDGPFGQIHLRDSGPVSGDSPPLVLLHQSPKSSREFTDILPKLARARRVIAIDNPGHGESDVLASIDDATIENYARSAWAAIEALRLGRIDIYGYHTGSIVGTEMAFQRPKDIRKMILVSAVILTPEETALFQNQFQPIPLDETGNRFRIMWENLMKYHGNGVTLIDLAASFAENLRAGEAYEWGHHAAFSYAPQFADRIKTLEHDIHVLNPGDMLHGFTPRVMPYLKNGTLIDKPHWSFGFMSAFTDETVDLVNRILG